MVGTCRHATAHPVGWPQPSPYSPLPRRSTSVVPPLIDRRYYGRTTEVLRRYHGDGQVRMERQAAQFLEVPSQGSGYVTRSRLGASCSKQATCRSDFAPLTASSPPLQDSVASQVTLAAGLIAHLIDSPLQENVEPAVLRLLELIGPAYRPHQPSESSRSCNTRLRRSRSSSPSGSGARFRSCPCLQTLLRPDAPV